MGADTTRYYTLIPKVTFRSVMLTCLVTTQTLILSWEDYKKNPQK